eukprot:scaffold667125_cov92-Prasinocladus_malaysianus.AAC.1
MQEYRNTHGTTDPGIGRNGDNQDSYTTAVFRDRTGRVTSLNAIFDGHGPHALQLGPTSPDSGIDMLSRWPNFLNVFLQAAEDLRFTSKSVYAGASQPICFVFSLLFHVFPLSFPQSAHMSMNHRGLNDKTPPMLGLGLGAEGGLSADLKKQNRENLVNRVFKDSEERLMHMLFLALEEELREFPLANMVRNQVIQPGISLT